MLSLRSTIFKFGWYVRTKPISGNPLIRFPLRLSICNDLGSLLGYHCFKRLSINQWIVKMLVLLLHQNNIMPQDYSLLKMVLRT